MTPLHPRLSDRQEAVLLLLADGHGLGEIAERLGTTTRAVRRLRDRARCELDAATTTQAVATVVRLRADSPDSGRPDTTRSDSDRLPIGSQRSERQGVN